MVGASREKLVEYKGYQIQLRKNTDCLNQVEESWGYSFRKKRMGKSSRQRRYRNHWDYSRMPFFSFDAALKAAKDAVDLEV